MMERVILVDKNDIECGDMEKMQAHESGVLHRAFSLFVFNNQGALLLQRRAHGKYHSGGLWTNTCCSHPRPGESILGAAQRRLVEEMGFVCDLTHRFTFEYRAELGNGLIEHEVDHVFSGYYEGSVVPNSGEVADYQYVEVDELARQIQTYPERFTPWLKTVWNDYRSYF